MKDSMEPKVLTKALQQIYQKTNMKRREFLKNTGVAAVAATMPVILSAPEKRDYVVGFDLGDDDMSAIVFGYHSNDQLYILDTYVGRMEWKAASEVRELADRWLEQHDLHVDCLFADRVAKG